VFTYDQALQQVLNRLAQIPPLPNNAQPQISPVSPIGEIYRYRLVGPPGYSVLDLKTLQDWVLQRRFRAVPGVIDVIGWGGKTKTFELEVDFNKLIAYGLTLPQLLQALNNSNINVGGNTVNIGRRRRWSAAWGSSAQRTAHNTMLTQSGGNPVLVRDVATVHVGHKPRLGIAGKDADDDIVQGIVLMRRGEQSMPTIKRVEREVERINNSNILPPGVRIERIYDRKELIDITTRTVLHNMAFGILLIFALQWVFLGNLRSALIVAATIPFALFFAVGILVVRGESANLLSVGAIDFGLVVDATVIMVESIYRRLGVAAAVSGAVMAAEGLSGKLSAIFAAASDVNRSIFFAAGIIIAGFLPLFTLSGVEGHIFAPMAKTYAYALAGGLLATFTVTPAISAMLLPEHVTETETWIVRVLHRLYAPALRLAVDNRVLTIAGAIAVLLLAGLAIRSLGLEFLPKLEEGNLWIRATMPSTISLEEGNTYVNRMRSVIGSFPEVESVVSQHGRPDDGTDAAGFFNAEFFAPLKPMSQWRPGLDKEALTIQILRKLETDFPGVEFNFSQYLQDNVAEAVSGVKGENSINATIRTAIGGESAGDLYEPGSDRHFPIVVRLAPQFRQNPEAIKDLRIGAQGPNGITQIPLNEVADVKLVSGPSYIYREGQERYLPIKFSVRDRDLGSAIQEAQRKVAEQVQLPAGSRLEWVGEFGNLQDAIARLKVVVPITLALIALLLWINFGSMADTLLAMSVIPMAVVGGVFALFLLHVPFSVSAAIGFIALFGISVMDGIIILSQFNQLIDAGVERTTAILRTGELQMRPVLMTCVIAGVGLLPAALSTGIGSQVQKPLAVVVVGGMTLAPLVILITLPVLILLFSRRATRPAPEQAVPAPAE
jgi:cobalt-zinc-cadmium resistance protein CzcA